MKLALILCACLILAACEDPQAMAKCQERHSFDTCFYTLHR